MKVLDIWNQFNKSAKMALSILALFLIVSLAHSFSSEGKLGQWRQDYEDFQQTAEQTTQFADSLQLVVDSAQLVVDSMIMHSFLMSEILLDRNIQIERLRTTRVEIEVRNDSTFETLTGGKSEEEVVSSEPPQAEPWIRLSFSYWEQIDILMRENELLGSQITDLELRDVIRLGTITSLQTSLRSETRRADTLQTIVFQIPEAPPSEKILGFIPLPSRKTSFIVGAIAGVAGSFALNKWLGSN